MISRLENEIAPIQQLSAIERQQLLQIFTQSNSSSNSQTDLKNLNHQFWQDTTLKELLATQTPITVHNLKHLAADFWPEEDSIEDFLIFLRQQRQEVI
ncbi:hypothetical protein PN478_13745 [Dolichospermum circinale CS-534/05]|uniref:hypothetical protein n=1 Tax=Dolichospermum circinale TaxID=109265 RepID=UPI00232ECB1D|nr:hypothetical protein [Dolichospermum circinale]MDB9456475.1 hypothetical protein [Dolichospermum circinale CS-541/06]MDB9464319.1 hypothetical protein [Dolichospermum circinale CS-541/04]MDB9491578.1 hypothetical protein [Dolichospermum circinale CS-534/05]MDB9547659.1 hypothetical protein [Dolichospermum circinale CS-1031]